MALIRWLKNAKRGRPTRIDAPPADSKKDGKNASPHVEPTFGAGSVVLARGDRLFTLVWSSKDTAKTRRRALPAGEYRVRTTRIEGQKDGAWWFLSSTGPAGEGRKVRVTKRDATKFSIADTVVFEAIVRQHRGKMMLGFSIAGTDGRGLSVYRDGKRVPVAYKILGKKGKTLAQGTMNYG